MDLVICLLLLFLC